MQKTFRIAALLAALGPLAAPAAAQVLPPEPDRVVLTLTAEDWVQTTTARLVVSVDAALTTRELPEVRARINDVLREIADVDWRITRFDRREDASGLVRWRIDAESRVPEPGLAGVHDRAKRQSRPGRKVRVVNIDFSPALAEREAVVADLRAEIYRQARAERDRLNEIFPDRGYRVRLVDFTGRAAQPRRAKVAEAMAEQRLMAAPAPVAVSRKVVLSATVVLAAPAPGAASTAR